MCYDQIDQDDRYDTSRLRSVPGRTKLGPDGQTPVPVAEDSGAYAQGPQGDLRNVPGRTKLGPDGRTPVRVS